MTIRIRHILILALLLASAYGGIRFEATRIQSTCEAQDEPTELNGSTYVCITLQEAVALRKRLQEHGA